MFTRTSKSVCKLLMALAVSLGACGQQPIPESEAPKGDPIACSEAGVGLAATCTLEVMQTREGLALTVRHADGAFRRMIVPRDGHGVVAADGAEPAVLRVLNAAAIEVAIGRDRYRLPSKIKGVRLIE